MHRHESMLSDSFQPLKRMYEQLSHGVSFDSPEQIAQRQLHDGPQAAGPLGMMIATVVGGRVL